MADFNRLMKIDACKEIGDFTLRSQGLWGKPPYNTVEEILKHRKIPDWNEKLAFYGDSRLRMDRLSGNDFLIGGWITGCFDMVCNHLLGLESFSYALVDEPDGLKELFQLECSRVRETARALAEVGFEFCFFHDDITDKIGPLMPPAFYEETIFPFYKELFGLCKELGLHVMYISDGNIDPLISSIYKSGCRGFFVLEQRCGVDPAVVRSLAPEAVLAGTMNSDIIIRGTPADIRRHVANTVKAAGWPQFMGTDGPLFEDVSSENMEALFAAFEENGG